MGSITRGKRSPSPLGASGDAPVDDNVRAYLREIGESQLLSKDEEAMLSQHVESSNKLERIEWDIRGTLLTQHGFKEYPRNRDQLPDNPSKVQASEIVAHVLRRLGLLAPIADQIAIYMAKSHPVTLEQLLSDFDYRTMINSARRYTSQGHKQITTLRVAAPVLDRHP